MSIDQARRDALAERLAAALCSLIPEYDDMDCPCEEYVDALMPLISTWREKWEAEAEARGREDAYWELRVGPATSLADVKAAFDTTEDGQ